MNTTKKCPMCAEMIPHEAETCEYCGAKFAVTITGYCTKCHEIREADANSHCKVCGTNVADLRVESNLIEEAAPLAPTMPTEPTPVPTPFKQSVPSAPKRGFAVPWVAGGILVVFVCGAIGAALWFARSRLPVISGLFATPTPPTASPSFTPAITLTRTPRPTATATPVPAWVTDFAQPILDAIAERSPSLQDDFGPGSAGWHAEDWCGRRMEYVEGELVITSCTTQRVGMDYPDFVVELDGRFLPDTKGTAHWALAFRHLSCPHCSFGVTYDGSIALCGLGGDDLYFPLAALPGYQTNHLLMIAKGGKFAFYVNDQPFYYIEDAPKRWGNISLEVWEGGNLDTGNPIIVAFDNFKIWDIYDLP